MGWLERIELSISAPQTEVLPLNYSHHITNQNDVNSIYIPYGPITDKLGVAQLYQIYG